MKYIYDELNLKDGNVFTETHLQHLEDGIKMNVQASNELLVEQENIKASQEGVLIEITSINKKVESIPGAKDNAQNNSQGEIFNDYTKNSAKGKYSHVEGQENTATNTGIHVEGRNNEGSGLYSHVEGRHCYARGEQSHAQNRSTQANGNYSHAEGYGTIAEGEAQHVQGKYNLIDDAAKYAHIVGNGRSSKRSNAYTLDWNGNAEFAGTVKSTTTPAAPFLPSGIPWNER